MADPHDNNQQDSYDSFMGEAMTAAQHHQEITNIPDASIQHDGTQLSVASQPKHVQAVSQAKNDKKTVGDAALEALRQHMMSGSTKTGGKGNKKR